MESTLTWNNAPFMGGPAVDSLGPVAEGTWVEFDVTATIQGDGVYSFGLRTTSSNSARYDTKEASNPPQLVIQTIP